MNARPPHRPSHGSLSGALQEAQVQRRKLLAVIVICVVGAAAVAWDLYRRFNPPAAASTESQVPAPVRGADGAY